jgi:hypothetical protein
VNDNVSEMLAETTPALDPWRVAVQYEVGAANCALLLTVTVLRCCC